MQTKPDPSNYRELVPGVFMKTLAYGEHTLLSEFKLMKGAVIPAHQHPQEQTGYLVRGSLRFSGDEGESIVEPGCSWSFKGGMMHGATALEDSTVVEVFSPVRTDYLPEDKK